MSRWSTLLAACLPSLCQACGEPVEAWGGLRRFAPLCERCRTALVPTRGRAELEPGLTLLWAFRPEPTIRALIKGLKYGGRDGALPLLIAGLARRLAQDAAPRPWALQPVPMPLPRRLRRGFNQSALLAEGLARVGEARTLALLRRRALAGRQAGRGRAERLRRAASEFSARGAAPSSGSLILVDDLCTTGATLRACRAVLDPTGERAMLALVLTRIAPPGVSLDRLNPP